MGPASVAHALKIGEEVVKHWEEGTDAPSLSNLRKIAHLYKRPLAALLLDRPPAEGSFPRDYRRVWGSRSEKPSPEFLLAVRRARRAHAAASELAGLLGRNTSMNLGRISDQMDPEIAAESVRNQLSGEPFGRARAGSHNANKVFKLWRTRIEACNILVLEERIPIEEARGFSLNAKELPTIVVNKNDSAVAKTFTLFHELCHLLMSQEGICDLANNGQSIYDPNEAYCNRFAGALLVPKGLLAPLVPPHLLERYVGRSPIDYIHQLDEELGRLSARFCVSRDVVIRRLADLGFVPKEIYQEWRRIWMAQPKEETKKRGGRVDMAHKRVNEWGFLFSSIVSEALRSDEITSSDAADYLNLRVKHLPKIGYIVAKAFG